MLNRCEIGDLLGVLQETFLRLFNPSIILIACGQIFIYPTYNSYFLIYPLFVGSG